MEVGISTACFYPQPLEDTIERVAKLGIQTVEIFFNTESEMHEPFYRELRERIQQNGLSVVSLHPFTSLMEGILLFSEYARRTEDGFAQYRHYFRAARGLGAKYLTLHGERLMPGVYDTQTAMERKITRYQRLCEIAAEEGMIVAQENVAWCRSSDPAYLQMLYEHVPDLRYTLDIKQANRAGHSWKEYFDLVAPRLVNIHINDFDQTRSCLLPGEGLFDYDEFFAQTRAAGYDKQTLIEVYAKNFSDDQQIVDSVTFLRQKIRQARYRNPQEI